MLLLGTVLRLLSFCCVLVIVVLLLVAFALVALFRLGLIFVVIFCF
jgi:hypothetical protein